MPRGRGHQKRSHIKTGTPGSGDTVSDIAPPHAHSRKRTVHSSLASSLRCRSRASLSSNAAWPPGPCTPSVVHEPCLDSVPPRAAHDADSDDESIHDHDWHDRYFDEADSYKDLVNTVIEMRERGPMRNISKSSEPLPEVTTNLLGKRRLTHED